MDDAVDPRRSDPDAESAYLTTRKTSSSSAMADRAPNEASVEKRKESRPDRRSATTSWRHALDLTWVLIEREVKIQYKATAIGFVWALAGPLLQLGVYSFLFSRVLTLDIPNYHLFVFPGILAWTWFQASLSQAAVCITAQPELIRQ